jgi:hypothetical protein
VRWNLSANARSRALRTPSLRVLADDRSHGVQTHYPKELFAAHPDRVWTSAAGIALNHAICPWRTAPPCHVHSTFARPLRAFSVTRVTVLTKLLIPLGGQEVELQELDFEVGPDALPLLRTRVREGKRFTVFDIDPASALAWGEALVAWAQRQGAGPIPDAGPRDA